MEETESYKNKEYEILRLPHRYLIFIDEVGDPFVHFDLKKYDDPSVFPVMTVTAVIVSRSVYQDILMPGLDEIKEYFFQSKDIYFHSREIRRKDGIFKIFLNENLYSEFKRKIDLLLDKSSITIISSSIMFSILMFCFSRISWLSLTTLSAISMRFNSLKSSLALGELSSAICKVSVTRLLMYSTFRIDISQSDLTSGSIESSCIIGKMFIRIDKGVFRS